MEDVNKAKLALTGILAGITAVLGWFGWLVILFVACLVLDYLTGTFAAGRAGKWESKLAREGLWHKTGSIIAVMGAAIADGVLGLVINNMPHISLPFEYDVLICPVVIMWYIFTELGSIIENAEKLGAPVPPFLRGIIAACKSSAEKAGNIVPNKEQSDK